MTVSIKRFCQFPGCCNEITSGSFCANHKPKPRKPKNTYRKETNSNKAGYTYRWQKARKIFLQLNPLCARCGEPATDVDHIVPHKGDMVLFWDSSNWQSLCHKCHSKKTYYEDGGWGRPTKSQISDDSKGE